LTTGGIEIDSPDNGNVPRAGLPETWRIFTLAVVFEGGLGLLACAIGWWCGYWPLQTFRLEGVDFFWGIVGTLPLFAGLVWIDRHPIGPFAALKQVVQEILLPMFRGFRAWQLLIVAILAGAGEEILFRGLLQGGVSAWLELYVAAHLATVIGLAVASLLFGLMHHITRMYATICVLVGLYLGGLWILTGNLLTAIIVHALYDFLALLYLLRGSRDVPAPPLDRGGSESSAALPPTAPVPQQD
jgi:membrane protease YdiL (CAAX protease family)